MRYLTRFRIVMALVGKGGATEEPHPAVEAAAPPPPPEPARGRAGAEEVIRWLRLLGGRGRR